MENQLNLEKMTKTPILETKSQIILETKNQIFWRQKVKYFGDKFSSVSVRAKNLEGAEPENCPKNGIKLGS